MPPSPTTGAAITWKKAGTTDSRPRGTQTGVFGTIERNLHVSNFTSTLIHLTWRDVLSALPLENLRYHVKTLSRNQAMVAVTMAVLLLGGVVSWLTFKSSSYNLTPEYRRQESVRVIDVARKSEAAAHGQPPSAAQVHGNHGRSALVDQRFNAGGIDLKSGRRRKRYRRVG